MGAAQPVTGRYRIESHVASGGMGEVYRARMIAEGGFAKPVALKVVRGELAAQPGFVEMFVDEARIAMGMSHANVVQAFDVGRIDDMWFIAMEYVDGLTLGALARRSRKRGRPMPMELMATTVVEALRGLDYAHRLRGEDGKPLGVVHRDISPGNILVSREGEVKLTDFGIAKTGQAETGAPAGTVRGKIAYMAPEQLRSETVDARADVYAMGVVLYELLAGRRPYAMDDLSVLVPAVLEGRRPPLDEVAKDAPPALRTIADRAMSVAKDARFPSAGAMRQAIEDLARTSGWLLAPTDLADFVAELDEVNESSEDARSPVDRRMVTPQSNGDGQVRTDRTERDSASSGKFALRLGLELRRVDADEPVSVFFSEAHPVPAERTRTSASEPAGSEGRRGRGRRAAGRVALGLVGAAVVVWVGFAVLPEMVQRGAWDARVESEVEAAREDEAELEAEEEAWRERMEEAEGEGGSGTGTGAGAESGTGTGAGAESGTGTGTGAESGTGTGTGAESEAALATDKGPRVRAHRTKAAAVREPAELWIASEPWGFVLIDGTEVGRTMLREHEVAPGRHEILVRNPAAGLERRVNVTLAPGETRRLSLTLAGAGERAP